MQRLITGGIEARVLPNLLFALAFIFAMFVGQRRLTGIWKSTLILWAMLFGSLVYFLLFPDSIASFKAGNEGLVWRLFSNLTTDLSLDPGVLIAFLFCFLALMINDLGSIQSIHEVVKPSGLPQRITRGITVTGLTNMLSGFFGVLGPVNYSISAGVIISTGNASRFTLAPAALLLVLLSFSPVAVGFIGGVPSVITGSVLLYVLCAQVSAALMVVFESKEGFQFFDGLILGLSVLLGTIIAFLPSEAVNTFPSVLKPILGNGFVVGVITALILEHLVFRD
jgi:xanthine/uracil permease